MYVPTTLGYVAIIAAIVIALLIASSLIIGKREKKISAKQLAVSAICVALAFLTSNIKLFSFPFGGSVTLLSMLFICIIGYWYGFGAGILTGVAYGFLQMIVDPYVLTLPQLLVDYPLAFGALGLSGIGYHFDKKHKYGGLLIGYICGVLGRYFFAFISGWIFFGEYAWKGWGAVAYSLAYNGAYLGAEAVITIVIIAIPYVQRAFKNVKTIIY
ncbi:MAG: energy-coupled thiamine transporter ThiT [Eubacterium sp.]|nr:energy-coupled thiamine transporter ThiT [Eubacterium sp.]